MTTLLVEDNPLDVRMIRYAIEQEAWNTDMVVLEDGEKAIQYLSGEAPYQQSARPDFIILDLNLPKRSGAEVLSVLRSTDSLANLPVVLLSSSPEDVIRDVVHQFQLTVDLFVTKPISLKAYLAIGRLLRDCYENKIKLSSQPGSSH